MVGGLVQQQQVRLLARARARSVRRLRPPDRCSNAAVASTCNCVSTLSTCCRCCQNSSASAGVGCLRARYPRLFPGYRVWDMLRQMPEAETLLAQHVTTVRGNVAADQSHQGRLAGAIATQKTHAFALFDMERHVLEHQRTTKAHTHISYTDQRHIFSHVARVVPWYGEAGQLYQKCALFHAGGVAAGGLSGRQPY